MTNDELIEGCRRRERSFQEKLYHQLSAKMFGVCLGYARNAEDAKDILHDAFVKIFETIDQYKGQGPFEAWARRIFVNTAIDKYRRTVNSNMVSVDTFSSEIEPADNSLVQKIDMEEFLNLIHSLPDGCRLIFNLHVIEGYKHREIAKMLNISEGTSKSQVHEAKKILQKKSEVRTFKPIIKNERRVYQLVPQ